MGALEVGDDPAVQTADDLMSDLDVPRRDPPVDRDLEVPLGPADDEPVVADADGLAFELAVVEDRQDRDRRPDRGPERAGRVARGRPLRPAGAGAVRRGLGARLEVLQEGPAGVLVGLDHGGRAGRASVLRVGPRRVLCHERPPVSRGTGAMKIMNSHL